MRTREGGRTRAVETRVCTTLTGLAPPTPFVEPLAGFYLTYVDTVTFTNLTQDSPRPRLTLLPPRPHLCTYK